MRSFSVGLRRGPGVRGRKEGPAVLKKVAVVDNEKNTTVVIATDKPAIFTTLRQQDPPKLILDLAGVEPGEAGGRINVDKGPVSYITSYKAENAKQITRVEIALTTDAESIITQNDSSINVIISKTEKHVFPGAVTPEAEVPEAPSAPEKKVAGGRVANRQRLPQRPRRAERLPPAINLLSADAGRETLTHISLLKEDGHRRACALWGTGYLKSRKSSSLGHTSWSRGS